MKKSFVFWLVAFWGVIGLNRGVAADHVWILPCTEPIANFEQFPLPSKPYEIVLGRGETEHVQLVLDCIPKETLTLTSSAPDGAFHVSYRLLSEIDGFMDALVPFSSTVKSPSSTAVVWITFETPRDAKVATYDFSLNIKGMKVKKDIHFSVRVADYEIPLTPSIPSEFCIDVNNLPDNGSDEQKELWTEFLLSRRIDPYYSYIFDVAAWRWDSCFSPWAWDDPRSQKLLEDPRFCRFALPFKEDEAEIKRMCADMKAKGLLDRCYFYIWDEPKKPEHYEDIIKESTRLLAIEPEAKTLVPISSSLIEGENRFDYKYTFNHLSPYVHIFPMAADEYKAQNVKAEEFRKLIEPRSEWWTYVCCAPKGAQPNFLLEQSPFNNRAIMWRVWLEQETGFLYWGVNRYRMNPFAFDRSLDAVGDGGLVFPGELFGVKEPVASVRLERWKEGQEDYEMLRMVEKMAGRSVAESILKKVYRSPSDYTSKSVEIEDFRKQLIQLLETFDASSQVIIRGELCTVDTLDRYAPGPGSMYAHVRIGALPIEAHVLTVDLQNQHVRVKTFLGNDVIGGLETVSSACQRFSNEQTDAFAGINGDFFNIKAHNELPIGAPRGGCMTDGEVLREPRSMEWAFAAVDFSGKPYLDNMGFKGSVVSLKAPIASYQFQDVNLPRTDCHACDMTFYNQYAGGFTRMDENADIGEKLKTEVFFKLAEGQSWKVNASVTCIVSRIIKDTKGNNALQEGEAALSGIDDAKAFLDKLVEGQKLKLNFSIQTAGGDAPNLKEMIGGNSLLMKDGINQACCFNDSYNNVLYPRTGVGCSEDGRWLYLMAIDGRQEHSRGVYADEMCDIFRSLGASRVVGMDGGGSTVMVVNHQVKNKPSDGSERAVADGWMICTQTPADQQVARLDFGYWKTADLANKKLPLSVMGYNQYGVLVHSRMDGVSYTCSEGLGHIEGETLILDGVEGCGTVTATWKGISVSRYLDLNPNSSSVEARPEVTELVLRADPERACFILQTNTGVVQALGYALYNLSGRCVEQGTVQMAGSHTLDFSACPAGVYLLRANLPTTGATFKIVIR